MPSQRTAVIVLQNQNRDNVTEMIPESSGTLRKHYTAGEGLDVLAIM